MEVDSPSALGIGAASFFREGGDEAEKDRAESPTAELEAEPERPNKDYEILSIYRVRYIKNPLLRSSGFFYFFGDARFIFTKFEPFIVTFIFSRYEKVCKEYMCFIIVVNNANGVFSRHYC
ncbi:MAG: hypothetical protein IKW51_06460 [Bacteroidales bacterium]|nr:hypothetical protein [Bacteroidales bacterium]